MTELRWAKPFVKESGAMVTASFGATPFASGAVPLRVPLVRLA